MRRWLRKFDFEKYFHSVSDALISDILITVCVLELVLNMVPVFNAIFMRF